MLSPKKADDFDPLSTKSLTMRTRILLRRARDRRGAATVEFAFVLPVFLTFVFGILLVGHSQMVSNLLRNACRSAARQGATENVSTAQVEDLVRQMLSPVMDTSLLTLMVKDARSFDSGGDLPDNNAAYEALPDLDLDDAEPRQLFVVRVSVDYSDISMVNMPWFKDVQLSSQAYMRHE